ncbi:hypothetical protein, partial [Burkholderia multivorans]
NLLHVRRREDFIKVVPVHPISYSFFHRWLQPACHICRQRNRDLTIECPLARLDLTSAQTWEVSAQITGSYFTYRHQNAVQGAWFVRPVNRPPHGEQAGLCNDISFCATVASLFADGTHFFAPLVAASCADRTFI